MALQTRFKMLQFIRRHRFKNRFTNGTKSSHKMQLPSFIRIGSQNRTANFADSLRFTQNELVGDFYIVGKL